jgi:hypothetical protein
MTKRVLIAVESCFRDAPKHQAIRDTWFRDILAEGKKFFLGGAGAGPFEDEVFLGTQVSDSYESLPLKTRAICKWALEHDFDFVFKVDTDTVVNPWTWFDSRFWEHDYVGGENADTDVPGFAPGRIEFCSGGAGYISSKKSLTIVAEAPILGAMQAEDVFVADALLKHGIKPVFHPGFRWRPGAKIDRDVISLHLSSALQKKYRPEQMYEAYKQIKEGRYGFRGVQ